MSMCKVFSVLLEEGVYYDQCVLLAKLYAEYIMQNPRLDETQTGIKISRRNINNLRYADDNHP